MIAILPSRKKAVSSRSEHQRIKEDVGIRVRLRAHSNARVREAQLWIRSGGNRRRRGLHAFPIVGTRIVSPCECSGIDDHAAERYDQLAGGGLFDGVEVVVEC
jgi:hypothetical protein